jgi:drug/metabolite transporter (DMT)-like permease
MAHLLAAYFLYALGDAAAKWLVGSMPVWEVLFIRSAIAVSLCLLIGGPAVLAALRRMGDKRELFVMNLANFLGWSAYYSAAVRLPLPQLYTIYYLSPIIAALLAGPMLGEKIRAASWIAAALGFAGVIISTAPASAPLPDPVPALLGLSAALMWGLSSVLYRRNVHEHGNLELVAYSNVVIGVCSALPLPWLWRTPALGQGGLLLVVGMAALGANLLYVSGVRRVSVGAAGPIAFFSLIWSALLGYLIWGDVPRPALLAGAVLILGAGLLAFGDQWRRGSLERR